MAERAVFEQLVRDYRWAWERFEDADPSQFDTVNEALTLATQALNSYIQDCKRDAVLIVRTSADARQDSAFGRIRVS
jgi:hypothetical protein